MEKLIVHVDVDDIYILNGLPDFIHAWQCDELDPREWGRLRAGKFLIRFFTDVEKHTTVRYTIKDFSKPKS